MYYYIINPSAGNGKINKIQEKLKGILSNLGIAGEFVKSTGPGDIPKLTEIGIKKGYSTIVAIGGDSTANEVLNYMPNDKTAFGIIPVGKTNTLASSLGIPDWMEACQILAARKTRRLNIGEVVTASGNRYFINKIAIGLEADIRKNFPSTPKQIVSKVKHNLGILKNSKSFNPFTMRFEIDKSIKGDFKGINIHITNVSFQKSDKAFMISLQENVPKTEKIKFIKTGDLSYLANHNSTLYGNHIYLKSNNISVAADDQYIGATPAEISIANKKIRIIVGSIF
ncbi:MAG: hypothetical protein UT66_C0021G0007 [candidate division CPR2 bacterium GW2011_GWC1_39_9]|uniref:DAGKc domain-containing protein n=1 Tax=candidate division CPR2 bacterium GW2011_GWC2_39_10 TaxID=1618345 RepID=A0A0G0P7T0_UNCC2|nr:MAG: hypothetical protein UT18_C0012G0011 [candidate division CPR2 bacterium GW2011_GWC2_39_10]KKR34547.1 MAG: hypothetical protein UT66_C0021G0007 [candidate division CPR2 bacterium GW2011_GWC1_39_9]